MPAAIVVAVLVAAVAWPLAGAFLSDDDFALLAQARLLGNPLWAFVHDHMLTMPYYRPLGVLAWWSSAQAFGTALAPQYALSMALHVGVCLALAGLLREFGTRRVPAWTLAGLFAIHPAMIGTASWLSDRYDLLATLFGLLALRETVRCARAADPRRLALVAGALAAALLSKETGLVLAAAATILAWRECADRRWCVTMIAVIAGVTFLYFLARWRVLGYLGGGRFSASASPWLVVQGFGRWWANLPGHLVYAAWLPRWAWALSAAGWLGAAWCVIAARHGWRNRGRGTLLLLGAAIVVLAATVQSPFLGLDPIYAASPEDVRVTVNQSRYYYLAFTGLVLLVAALPGDVPDRPRARRSSVATLSIACLLASFMLASGALTRAYRDHGRPLEILMAAVVAAVERIDVPAEDCRIYLLDAGNKLLDGNADVMLKSRIADLPRVAGCLVQTERAPWFHLVPAAADGVAVNVAPLQPLHDAGRRVPWSRVGNVQVLYLEMPADADASRFHDGIFLARDGDAFRDVGAEVRAGRREVRFHCGRRPSQCP